MNKLQEAFHRITSDISTEADTNKYSVLVPIVSTASSSPKNLQDLIHHGSLLFEVRSKTLARQPGEICFPGGRIEADESKLQAAIRETSEELLLAPENIMVLGALDTIVTPFNSIIYSYCALLSEYKGTYNKTEVCETFMVPLSYFYNTKPLQSTVRVELKPDTDFPYHLIQNGSDYTWAEGHYPVYFYLYNDRIIWGITARIISSFVEAIKAALAI